MDAYDYFITLATLLGVYAFFRVIIWLELRNDLKPVSRSASYKGKSHPIDTTQLEHRLEEVRRDFAAEAQTHPSAANKPLLVEQRRAEIAKLAFFQKPPPEPEPPEKEPGSPMLFAL